MARPLHPSAAPNRAAPASATPTSRRHRPASALTVAFGILLLVLAVAALLGAAVAWAGPGPSAGPVPGPKTDPGSASRCVVPEGPILARVAWRGRVVVARPGALELGGVDPKGDAAPQRLTPCEGLPAPHPQALAVGPDGALYVGFRQAGLFRVAPPAAAAGTSLPSEALRFEAVAGVPAGAGVRALDASGDRLYVGTGAGLWVVPVAALTDPAAVRTATAHPHRVLGRREVTALRVAADGVHVGLGPYGVWRLVPGAHLGADRAARTLRGFFAGCFSHDRRPRPLAPGPACDLGPAGAASGLPSVHVTALAWHRGHLVVGLFDAGLARATAPGPQPERFAPLGAHGPRLINALLAQGDTLYVGAGDGLYQQRGDGPVARVPVRLPSDHVNALAAAPDGTLWVAHSAGLTALGPAGVRHLGVEAGLPDRIVYAVAVAADGAVWAGTARGAVRFDAAGGVRRYDQAGAQLPHDWVTAFAPADAAGAMFAGTYDAGVARLGPDGAAASLPGLGHAWINPAGLVRQGHHLYLATLGDGLLRHDLRFESGDPGPERLHPVPGDDVTAALAAPEGLWIGTRGGLAWRPQTPHVALAAAPSPGTR